MRIVAHVGVKDEAELIERTIAHLRAVGVDHIIAIDDYSTDGTAELLEKYRSDSDFWVARLNATEQDKSLELVRKAKADWVIFLDADEYWLPVSGSLKDCATLATSDVLSVDRFNVPLGPDGPMMPAVVDHSMHAQVLFFNHLAPEKHDASTPWISSVPAPKVMARPERIGTMNQGNHDVVAPEGVPLRRSKPSDLMIAHLPFTTMSRFRRKVDNIRNFLDEHKNFYDPNMARHWRHWMVLDEQGRIEEEFARQVMSPETIAAWRAAGTVRSVAEMFARRLAANSAPAR